jgi:hypothetical protein
MNLYQVKSNCSNLFSKAEDVFAVHWEKGNKSGYMPAYFYDPVVVSVRALCISKKNKNKGLLWLACS